MTEPEKAPSGRTSPGDRVQAEALEAAERAIARHPLARGFALGAVVTAAMALFIFQNRSSVALSFLWFDFEVGLWFVLLVAFLAGGLATPLLVLGVRHFARLRSEQQKALQTFAHPGGPDSSTGGGRFRRPPTEDPRRR